MVTLEIIVPVYNEKQIISLLIRKWDAMLTGLGIPHRFIIAEDGSTDGTREKLQSLGKKYPLVVNHNEIRRGYRNAILAGLSKIRAPYVLHIDADGQYDPQDFKKIWKARTQADVIVGSRIKRNDIHSRIVYSHFFNLWFTLLFPHTRTDPSSSFILYRPEFIIPYLNELRYLNEGFWWGFSALCIKKCISVKEVEIKHLPRKFGSTKVYALTRIPLIALRNGVGLLRLRWSH